MTKSRRDLLTYKMADTLPEQGELLLTIEDMTEQSYQASGIPTDERSDVPDPVSAQTTRDQETWHSYPDYTAGESEHLSAIRPGPTQREWTSITRSCLQT
jgi:hypothetical protein